MRGFFYTQKSLNPLFWAVGLNFWPWRGLAWILFYIWKST